MSTYPLEIPRALGKVPSTSWLPTGGAKLWSPGSDPRKIGWILILREGHFDVSGESRCWHTWAAASNFRKNSSLEAIFRIQQLFRRRKRSLGVFHSARSSSEPSLSFIIGENTKLRVGSLGVDANLIHHLWSAEVVGPQKKQQKTTHNNKRQLFIVLVVSTPQYLHFVYLRLLVTQPTHPKPPSDSLDLGLLYACHSVQ